MRNLITVQSAAHSVNSDLPLSAHALDTGTDSFICALGPTREKSVIELRRISTRKSSEPNFAELITSWDAPCPLPDLGVDKILSVHHFAHSDTTCLVLAGGDIVVARGQPLPGEEKIEIVGSVDVGITAAAWSPDEELLAITTRAETLLYMTIEFDNTASVSFHADDVKLSKHVSVGWGKAETQFKGKRAKALRDPTMPETVDEGVLSPCDRGQVTISWRGDGAYVAVNSIEAKSRRMIRIFTREGTLDSVTEPVNGLEGALTWRPAGNLLTGIQRLGEEAKVVFFERNGLRHGEFQLRLSSEDAKTWASSIDLSWNNDSSVLAVSFMDRVQLWTMGNYHYYPKQTLRIPGGCSQSAPLVPCWNPDKALQLSFQVPCDGIVATNGHSDTTVEPKPNNTVVSHELIFDLNHGPTTAPNDHGSVAVVDGKTLRLTPLRFANVPPPMAAHELVLQENSQAVAINSNNRTLAVLSETRVELFRCSGHDANKKPLYDFSERSVIELPLTPHQRPEQVCFVGEENFFVVVKDLYTWETSLYDHSQELVTPLPHPDGRSVLRIFPSVDHQMLCAATSDGICEILDGSEMNTLSIMPVPPLWAEVVKNEDFTLAFGLTATGALYANERMILQGCTSFLLTTSHLIMTTANHLLKFVHLTEAHDLEVPPDAPETDERCRSIERGAKLVSVMPSTYALVLQMPRGNLETIYPRALVLAGIRRNIERKHYRKAFLACRNHRVDMNILHDHAPGQFLDNVELFVEQLKSVEFIDLFLSQLRDENVSQTMYKDTLPRGTQVPNQQPGSYISSASIGKVNKICYAFLEVLQQKQTTNLQNLITAQVCQLPPNVEAALGIVASLREKELERAETAVEHICFLADVNQVYDTALGMYDIELTLLVAQQSQKDPREYLPYLQSLQELPQLRRQYRIDNDLGRHSKALRHLYTLKASVEVQQYTQRHELYTETLELYRYEPEPRSHILRLYADSLSTKSRFKEAAIAYESLSDFPAATDAYRAANQWRECLSTALSVPLPTEELQSVAHSLADALAEAKDFSAAATIHLDHLDDLEGSVAYLCKGYLFAEATRLVKLRGRTELLTSSIDAGLVEASAGLTEMLADCKAQLGAQVPRIAELRAIKAADPLKFFEGTDPSGDIPDNISLAASSTASTTANSLYTRYTNASSSTAHTGTTRKTSKNRRREERKRARGKKGSVYEEEYLVNSVGRLIERVNTMHDEVDRTVRGLLGRGMWERGRAVEEAMAEVVGLCARAVKEMWPEKNAVAGETTAGINGDMGDGEVDRSVRPPGADGVLWDSLEETRKGIVAPTVKGFEKSGLLG